MEFDLVTNILALNNYLYDASKNNNEINNLISHCEELYVRHYENMSNNDLKKLSYEWGFIDNIKKDNPFIEVIESIQTYIGMYRSSSSCGENKLYGSNFDVYLAKYLYDELNEISAKILEGFIITQEYAQIIKYYNEVYIKLTFSDGICLNIIKKLDEIRKNRKDDINIVKIDKSLIIKDLYKENKL